MLFMQISHVNIVKMAVTSKRRKAKPSHMSEICISGSGNSLHILSNYSSFMLSNKSE